MPNTILLTVAAALLAALLCFEKAGSRRGALSVKTPLSGLFILTAILQPHLFPSYAYLMLAGLVFCLGGDVCLALPGARTFRLGLVSFFIGHLFYCAAFFSIAGPNAWTWGGWVGCAALSWSIFRWLGPHLGGMFGPVMAYVVVITVMATGALTVFGDVRIAPAGRWMILAGALSFYVSDLFVARDRFVKSGFENRLAGLPLYYLGQFLLALSVGRVL
jgi:uncharacterized membrane protein YhhN